MSGKSKIEWTEATWNPIVGCSIISPGCTNCYAMKMAARIEAMNAGFRAKGKLALASQYDGTTKKVNGNAVWTGKIGISRAVLIQPIERKKPTVYFVNSEGDLFHEDIPDEVILDVFTVMAVTGHHTYQVLTKRHERMREFVSRRGLLEDIYANWSGFCGKPAEVRSWPLHNVWLGVSTERQKEADERIPALLQTPAVVRFISAEPLLWPINLPQPMRLYDSGIVHPVGLDWVIVGGESGPWARPMHPDWARSLRDQCAAASVPFFFKQWGEWVPHKPMAGGDLGGDVRAGRVKIVHPTGQSDVEVFEATGGRNTIPGSRYMAKVGKKRAGRLLDGKEHNGFPALARAEAT